MRDNTEHNSSNNNNNNNNNNNRNNDNNTVFTTHSQEKCIPSPHSNKSSILCQKFLSNSLGFYFSAIYFSKSYLSVMKTPLGVLLY